MTKKKPAGSQEWIQRNTDVPEDPNMYITPPGDYDLRAAQEDPDIAEIYLQYIAEDRGLGKKLSTKAENYLTHCWRRMAAGEDFNRAFYLVGKKGRRESTVERNVDMVGQYCARKNEGELVKNIIKDFWESHGISEPTFNEMRRHHREFCEEHVYLWSKEKILDIQWPGEKLSNIERIERYEAGKDRRAEYIEQCKSKDMKTDSAMKKIKRQNAPKRLLPNTPAQKITSDWLSGKNKP
jgi:hypothetical protein